jgi:hypothetical protein
MVRNKSKNDRLTSLWFAAYIRLYLCYCTAYFGLHASSWTAALLTSQTTWSSTRGRIQSSTPPESRIKADCCRSQASSYLGLFVLLSPLLSLSGLCQVLFSRAVSCFLHTYIESLWVRLRMTLKCFESAAADSVVVLVFEIAALAYLL